MNRFCRRAVLLVAASCPILGTALPAQYAAHELPNPENPNAGIVFGRCLDMEGDLLAVGAWESVLFNPAPAIPPQGKVHLYRRDPDGNWYREAILKTWDATDTRAFGVLVALSGETLAILAYGSLGAGGSPTHAVYIFKNTGEAWLPQGVVYSALGSTYGTASLALDGDTLVVGDSRRQVGGVSCGAVDVFERIGSAWAKTGEFTPAEPDPQGGYGKSVSVFGDTIAVGGSSVLGTTVGAVDVFTRDGAGWSLQEQVQPTTDVARSLLGPAVALHGDDLVVTRPGGTSTIWTGSGYFTCCQSGRVFRFRRSGSDWVQVTSISGGAYDSSFYAGSIDFDGVHTIVGDSQGLYPSPTTGPDGSFYRGGLAGLSEPSDPPSQHCTTALGYAVATDGDYYAVSDPEDTGGGYPAGGSVHIYEWGNDWEPRQTIIPILDGQPKDDRFGAAVDIDGTTAIVGTPDDSNDLSDAGSAWIHERAAQGWVATQRLAAPDEATGNRFGDSVAISGDTAVVGARFGDGTPTANTGAAYVFERSTGIWSFQQKLTAPDGAAWDEFGGRVSIDGDTILVGVERNDAIQDLSGSAYVFTRTGSVWSLEQKLVPSDGAAVDLFGCSVAVEGDTALIGARGDDDVATGAGAAYVYFRSGSTWIQQAKLTAPGAASTDSFGQSVAISGNTFVVGAPQNTHLPAEGGSAFVFVQSAGEFSEPQLLRPLDPESNAGFGEQVAASGNAIVVGASRKDGGGIDSGSAYVFAKSGGVWSQTAKLTDSVTSTNAIFGAAVAASQDRIIVGSPLRDGLQADSGTATIFERIGGGSAVAGWTAYP